MTRLSVRNVLRTWVINNSVSPQAYSLVSDRISPVAEPAEHHLTRTLRLKARPGKRRVISWAQRGSTERSNSGKRQRRDAELP